eukprot:ANDGO_04901.mRNA.1 Synaptotagmin-4
MPEYQVHVHVLESRQLVGKDSNGMSDPMVVVRVGDQRQETIAHKKTVSCVWDHHMLFTVNLSEEEFENGKIQIKVYDANTVFRNELIGNYDIDLSYVHSQKNHELYRRWVVLLDTIRHGSDIQGYLKVSAVVLAPGDSPPSRGADGDEDDEDDEEKSELSDLILRPPELDIMKFELCIRIYRAEHLPRMDKGLGGKCDPYVVAKFAGNKATRTDIVKRSYNPTWNQEIRLPVLFPCLSDRIEVTVMDYDFGTSDDAICTTFFRFTDVKLNEVGPKWINLYGAPQLSFRDSLSRLMNEGREEPTAYRGRVLVALDVEHADDPQLVVRNVSPCNEPPVDQYTLRFDLYQGSEFPASRMQSVEVEVCFGPHVIRSKSASVKGQSAQVCWFEPLPEIECSMPSDTDQLPDVIINVKVRSLGALTSRVGYLRLKPTDIWGFSNPAKWIMLEPDKLAAAYQKDMIAGFLLFALDFGRTAEAPKVRPPIERPKMMPYELRAHIYQARNLTAADPNGTSDPYVVVRLGSAVARTKRCDQTLFPVFYETVILEMELPQTLNYAPMVSVNVFDYDRFETDDFIGRLEIPCSKATKRFNPDPKWYDLYTENVHAAQGQLLCSFQLIPAAEARRIPLVDITPEFRDCIFEASIVGLRKLLPPGFRNLNSPYVEIEVPESVDESQKRRKPVKTKCSDLPSVVSPNILEVVSIPVRLPVNPAFAPTVNIRVYDKRLPTDDLIGSTAIPLGAFLPWAGDPSKLSRRVEEMLNAPGEDPLVETLRAVENIPGSVTGDNGKFDEFADGAEQSMSLTDDLGETDLDPIPDNLASINEVASEVLHFRTTGKSSRTIPEVGDTFVGAPDKEDDKKFEGGNRAETANELELTLKDLPFQEFILYRGTKENKRDYLSKWWRANTRGDGSEPSNGRTFVGKLKGRFRVFEAALKEKTLQESPVLDLAKLYAPQAYVVRAYILRGRHMVPKDLNGKSDPYLVLSVNKNNKKQHINARDEYCKETLSPDFYRMYELPVTLPGDSELSLTVLDRDTLPINDDPIGETVIDLENRLFCESWQLLNPKPKEFRTLWTPKSTSPQGKLELWLEILTRDQAMKTRPTPISPPAPLKFELRCIVWGTKDCVFKDAKMSDIYVSGISEWNGEMQKTDTHWRSKNGKGQFNWRFKFPVTIPCKVPRLKVQIWDKDILNPNDAIAEVNLNLLGLFKKCYKSKTGDELPQQWIKMTHPNFEGTQGKIQLTLQLLTESEAKGKPNGVGREVPNQFPELSTPNRPNSSYPPWRIDKAAGQFLWAHKWKIIITIVVAVVGYVAAYFLLNGQQNSNNGK